VVTEVDLDFPRTWLEFTDPADSARMFRCDTTWLTSRWRCIFGDGCPGIYASAPAVGCCTLGAHFSDDDDRERVLGWAQRLDESTWAHAAEGARGGVVMRDADGDEQTRVHRGACIFFNPPGFSGGTGCALHHLAAAEGVSITATKPDVCWQLPIRRDYDQRTWQDESSIQVVVITEYDRRGWGPGGHDLDWYCSGNTAAHIAADPVYVTEREALVELMGQPAYDELVRLIAAGGPALAHPADPPTRP
jgi:hypothetical protein